MKRFIACLAAFSLAGCTTLASVGPGIGTTATTVQIDATKALIVAHNAYQGAAAAAVVAVQSGKLNAGQLAGLKALNDRAFDILTKAGSGLSAAESAANVMLIVTQMDSITGGVK